MAEQGRRTGLPQVLTALAVVAVGAHLFGLYRPAGPPAPPWFPHVDKAEHVVGFAAPVALILLARQEAARASGGRALRRIVVLVVGTFALHAVVSELLQHVLYARRTGDPVDVLADWTGVALGWGTAVLLARPPATPAPGGPADLPVPR